MRLHQLPLFCALLLLPLLAFAQPAKKPVAVPVTAKAVAVTKAPVAKVVVTPATQMAHVVVAPASQPASASVVVTAPVKVAPASQPTTVAGWKKWLADNWLWILFAVLIPSLINGLKKKGVREGIIGFFESLLDRVSVTTNKNTVGTFKAPGPRSGPPIDPPKA